MRDGQCARPDVGRALAVAVPGGPRAQHPRRHAGSATCEWPPSRSPRRFSGSAAAVATVATVADSTPSADPQRGRLDPRVRRRARARTRPSTTAEASRRRRDREHRGRRRREGRRRRGGQRLPRRPRPPKWPMPAQPPIPAALPVVLFDPAAVRGCGQPLVPTSRYVAHATKGMPDHGALRRVPAAHVRLRQGTPRLDDGRHTLAKARRHRSQAVRARRRPTQPAKKKEGNRSGALTRPARRKATGVRVRPPATAGRPERRRQAPADPPELRRRAVRSVSGGASRVPVPHPLRVADHGRVVRRDAQPVGELVRGPRVAASGAGSTPPCWRRRRRSWSTPRSAARRRPRRRCGCRRTGSGARVSAAVGLALDTRPACACGTVALDLLPPRRRFAP